MPLTAGEAAEVERRVEAQQRIDPAVRWAHEADIDFAGAWIDQTAGGRAFFLVKRGSDGVDELRRRLPTGVDIEIRLGDRSWDELVALQDAILAEQERLIASGIPILTTGIHTPSNSVLVGLETHDPQHAEELDRLFGPGLTYREHGPIRLDTCPWTDCLPAKGGLYITSSQQGNKCTSGFMVKATSGSTNYHALVTAGHCFYAGGINDPGIGDDWTHYTNASGFVKLGDAERSTWYDNSSADVGLIRLSSIPSVRNQFVAYSSGSDRLRSLTGWASNADQQVGEYICRMGGNRDSGRDCGFMTVVNASTRESPVSGVGSKTILHQNEAAFDSLPGDSGGSVFVGSTAYGTHTHSTDAAPFRSWFTTIDWGRSTYQNKFDVSYVPCTTSSC